MLYTIVLAEPGKSYLGIFFENNINDIIFHITDIGLWRDASVLDILEEQYT